MADAIPEFRPSPDARELADALRSGLAVRRGQLDAHAHGADEARLRTLGDLEGLPPVAKPGPGASVIKLSRRVLQIFLRPWLAAQTIFNHEIARRLQTVMTSVRDLERRTPHLEAGLEQLTQRIQQLEGTVETTDWSHHDASDDAAIAGSLGKMFVHSRMPRPPSRVLTLGDGVTGVAMELATFGFDVCTASAAQIDPGDSTLRRCQSVLHALPFSEAVFDVVIFLCAMGQPAPREGALSVTIVAEVARVLKPRGRFIAMMPDVSDPTAASLALKPLRVTEMLRGTREKHVWSVDAVGAQVGGDQTQHEAALTFVMAER